MGTAEKGIKTVGDIFVYSAKTNAEFLKAIYEFLIANEKNKNANALADYIKKNGKPDFLPVDQKVFNETLKKELEKAGVTFVDTFVKDDSGQLIFGVFFPENQREIVERACMKANIELGNMPTVDRYKMFDLYYDDDINQIKNIDPALVDRIIDIAKEEGLSISTEYNRNGKINIYSPINQSEELAMAYCTALYELKTEYGDYLREKNEYENSINKAIQNSYNNDTEVYVIGKDGYPCLHMDKDRAVFTYKDEKGDIISEMKFKTEKDFDHFIGEKFALSEKEDKFDEYVVMTKEEYKKNEETKGEVLKEKVEKIPKEPENFEQHEQKIKEMKEKYRENYSAKDFNLDFKDRIEDFNTYMKHEISHDSNLDQDSQSTLYTELDRNVRNLEVSVCKGSSLGSIDQQIERAKDETKGERGEFARNDKADRKERNQGKDDNMI